MMVCDLWKTLLNRGEENPLFFWRDNTGNELDLIWEKGNELIPIDIKSGKTIIPDFFKNLRYWEKLSGNPTGFVIYGGNQSQKRSTVQTILPWHQLPSLLE